MANEMEWVKLNTHMLDNKKVKYLRKLENGNEICFFWVSLIMLAGQCGTSGELWLCDDIAYSAEMLAATLGFDDDVAERGLSALVQLHMIDFDGEVYHICGWDEHQSIDALERNREQSKERMKRYRERKKEETAGNDDSVTGYATVTSPLRNVTLQSKSKSKSKRESVSCNNLSHATGDASSAPAGCSPAIDEVKSFFSAEKLKGNPDLFFATYDATGWLDAHGNVIANWKSLAKKWSINEKKFADTSEPEHLSADELENQLAEVEQQLSELADVPEVSGASMSREQFSKHQLKIRRDTLREKLRKAG